MSPRRLFHCAGLLCLCVMNCSLTFSMVYVLAAIYKEPHAGLALDGAIYSACLLGVLAALSLICVTLVAISKWNAKASIASARSTGTNNLSPLLSSEVA
ncbi:hypothetical protein ACIOWK_20030 [Pseudomonas protegens]|uniref:hypothetical protein n=1 Tax=Pseudomonas protegens TaxID=380021 RepID=UPI00382A6CCA